MARRKKSTLWATFPLEWAVSALIPGRIVRFSIWNGVEARHPKKSLKWTHSLKNGGKTGAFQTIVGTNCDGEITTGGAPASAISKRYSTSIASITFWVSFE